VVEPMADAAPRRRVGHQPARHGCVPGSAAG
jgi:hypothetical protein